MRHVGEKGDGPCPAAAIGRAFAARRSAALCPELSEERLEPAFIPADERQPPASSRETASGG
jgi:hypothetical protein